MDGDTAAFIQELHPSSREGDMARGISNYLVYFTDVCGNIEGYRIIGRGFEGEGIMQYELDVECTRLDTVVAMQVAFVEGSWHTWESVGLQLDVPQYYRIPFVDSLGRSFMTDFYKKRWECIYDYSAKAVTSKQSEEQQVIELKEGRRLGKPKDVRYVGHKTAFRESETVLIITYVGKFKKQQYYIYITYYMEEGQYLFGHFGYIPI